MGGMVAVPALQLWATQRQRAQYEEAVTQYQAAMQQWHQRPKVQLGLTMPMLPVWQPPPLVFPALIPVFLFPMLLVVAAEQQRLQKLQHEEEEDRTPYTEEELMQDWEFKIVRTSCGLFDRPEFLQRVLGEEARVGWQLVEKFDATRVRLKRHPGQAGGAAAGHDPYRTWVGPRSNAYIALWIFCGVCAVLVPVVIAGYLLTSMPAAVFWSLLGVTAGGALVLGFLAVWQGAKYRRLLLEG